MKLSRFPHRRYAFRFSVLLVAALSWTPLAIAIAPMQQQTNPAAFSNLFSVVDTLNNAAGTADVGTGSIFMSSTSNGIGYFCVLTCAHNFPSSADIGFGVWGSNGNGATSFTGSNVFPIIGYATGGPTGSADLAVALVRYGPVNTFFNNVVDLSMWNAPALSDSVLASFVSTGSNGTTAFSEIGYGDTGTPLYSSGVQTGFNKVNSSGIQRFQNNTLTAVNVNASHGTSTVYTDYTWTPGPVSPGNPNLGTGSSFTGDSGGPYMISSPITLNIAGLTDVFDNSVGTQNINVDTNSIIAVHTFGDNNNPQLFSDANIISGGVLLTAADETWVNQQCGSLLASVPEPSTVALLAVGGTALALGLRVRRRRLA